MAEKRKLPARHRGGPAAKKRISDAGHEPPQQRSSTPAKKTATPAPPPSAETIAIESLPSKIQDSQPLPTLPKPQTQIVPFPEYQSYAESGVVSAALQRSKTKWLQDCLFEKYWAKPSRKKNQAQPAFPNPPKDSMTKVGPCTMVIEPHYFEIMLYTVRKPLAQTKSQPPPPPPPQQTPPHKPIIPAQYPTPNNSGSFHEYQPRPSANSHSPNATPPNPIVPTYPPASNRGPIDSSRGNEPNVEPTQRNPPRPPPNPSPPSSTLQKPQTPAPPPPKPSADPVIQLLANRAATNPDLRALMRIVADSQADQEQLRAFQAHIDEINEIIAKRKQESQPATPPVAVKSPAPPTTSHSFHPPGGATSHALTPIASRSPVPAPGPPSHHVPPSKHPYPPAPSASPAGGQPIRSKPPQKLPPAPNSYFRQHFPPPPVPPPPKYDIQSVVFEFILPAGSNQGATGDRYLFPDNMILDYFPGNTTVIASFLAIKQIDSSNGSLDKSGTSGKKAKKSKLPPTSSKSTTSGENTTAPQTANSQSDAKLTSGEPTPAASKTEAVTTTAGSTPDPSSSNKSKVKEYYQPVTLRLHANNSRTLEPLGRVVKPSTEVRDYMNAVMDRMDRADIGYLALRLPHEQKQKREVLGENGDKTEEPARSTNKSKARRGIENNSPVLRDDHDLSEEELQEYYDTPSSLVPLKW